MSMTSIRNIYRHLRPKLIICDFDGTMTLNETITPLITLAKQNWTNVEVDGFTKQLEWYHTNHNIYEQELLSNLTKYRNDLINGTKYWNINEIKRYFTKSDELDQQSLQKLDINGKYLANIQLDDLNSVFREHIRLDTVDLLTEFINDNCVVKVLSHNWSSYPIYNALNKVISQNNIMCNELQCNKQNITTGKLFQKCVTSIHKMEYVLQWKNDYIAKYGNSDQIKCMYIGDQWGDFLANCCADVSVWITTNRNHQFLDIVNDKYLMNKTDTSLVCLTDSWT